MTSGTLPLAPTDDQPGAGFRRALAYVPASSEESLREAIRLARRGDESAIRYLYSRYADSVYRYVVSFVRDAHEAEDVTQNVFAKLITVIRKYEEHEAPFLAWVLRVARNAALDNNRRQRTVPVGDLRSPQAGPDDTVPPASPGLREALSQLPSDQRRVVVMRHVVGLSPTEIARELGRTEASVHAIHHRGRCTLRHRLSELDAVPATVNSKADG